MTRDHERGGANVRGLNTATTLRGFGSGRWLLQRLADEGFTALFVPANNTCLRPTVIREDWRAEQRNERAFRKKVRELVKWVQGPQ